MNTAHWNPEVRQRYMMNAAATTMESDSTAIVLLDLRLAMVPPLAAGRANRPVPAGRLPVREG